MADATKTRKRLLDAFSRYDAAAKRIKSLPTDSPTQERLQNAINLQAVNFLQLHMLPLQTLPRILKHASPSPLGPNGAGSNGNARPGGALAAIKLNDQFAGNSSAASSSSAVSAVEAEEKQLKERLIVLEEQKFLVGEMIADANKRRKFDEVSSLSMNVEDLGREIDQVQGMLGQLDVEGAYGTTIGNGMPSVR
jgi:rabenosyn-5